MQVTRPVLRPTRRRRDERGAIAIIVALTVTLLLVVTAMVLDFGLVRLDRQQAKLTADTAVAAGLRAGDGGTDKLFTFQAVCGALSFLKANDPSMSGLPSGICSAPSTSTQCDPLDNATKAVYSGTVTSGGVVSTVTIKAPYQVSDGGFTEESLGTLSTDVSTMSGCDQLGVIISQSRDPGLGNLATSSKLKIRIRSVGRVGTQGGDLAPALLLLERTHCTVVSVGSAGAGSGSHIYVAGTLAPDLDPVTLLPKWTPGSIHSDSDATGSDCGSGSGQQLFQGKQADGIVAYGTPIGLSGVISSYATSLGRSPSVVSDSMANVYGISSAHPLLTGSRSDVAGRGRVFRTPVDKRYLAGLKTVTRAAYSKWTTGQNGIHSQAAAVAAGYTKYYSNCNAADMTSAALLLPTAAAFFDCPGNSGITMSGTISAGTIYFHGFIKSGNLSMPNATTVYIDNTNNSGAKVNSSAITLGTNNGFCVRAALCASLAVGACNPAALPLVPTARLIVRRGSLDSGGTGLLRLCGTSVIMESGDLGNGTAANPGGCLPATNGIAPTATPCPGATTPDGSGLVQLGRGDRLDRPEQVRQHDHRRPHHRPAAGAVGQRRGPRALDRDLRIRPRLQDERRRQHARRRGLHGPQRQPVQPGRRWRAGPPRTPSSSRPPSRSLVARR